MMPIVLDGLKFLMERHKYYERREFEACAVPSEC